MDSGIYFPTYLPHTTEQHLFPFHISISCNTSSKYSISSKLSASTSAFSSNKDTTPASNLLAVLNLPKTLL
jgi:hypothetical protein